MFYYLSNVKIYQKHLNNIKLEITKCDIKKKDSPDITLGSLKSTS